MDYQEGMRIFQALKISGNAGDENWQDLYLEMLNCAVKYAQTRANWYFMNTSQRSDKDSHRTIQHNAFIANLSILTRYVKSQGRNAEWEPILEQDRKEIGDLACYINCALSIQSR